MAKIIISFVSLQEMEAYIRGLIPSLAQLRDMPTGFIQMYCRIAAHKFFFFCDPHRRGLHGLSFSYYKELILSCNILISRCQCNILPFVKCLLIFLKFPYLDFSVALVAQNC